MKQPSLVLEETIYASVETVWKAITDVAYLRQWFFDLPEFKPEKGFEFRFEGEGNTGRKYMHICNITEVIPLKKLQYSWTYQEVEGYTIVTFELFEEGDQTRLRFSHEGLETFPQDNADFGVESFTKGWTYLIGTALKTFVEKEKSM